MPNWVFNSLAVSGEPADITAFREAIAKPYETHFPKTKWNEDTKEWESTPDTQINEGVFLFWNVVSPTDLESYYGESYKSDKQDLMERITDAFANGEDWYNWNVRHWGTKWDASDAEITDSTDNYISYRFDTAWSPPMEVITALAEMYPHLDFSLEYEEEQGWGGEVEFHEGEMITHREWDIPSSHSDFEALSRDCPCSYEDDPEWWYSDCPVDSEKYEWDEDEMSWVEKERVEA